MYIKVTSDNLIWPYSIENLRQEYPNVSFPNYPTPQDLEPFSVYIVHQTDKPKTNDPRLQIIEEILPKFIDNKWQQSWKTRSASKEEIDLYDINNRPQPNWSEFKIQFLADQTINNYFSSRFLNYPLLNLSLTASLILDNYDTFIKIWQNIKKTMSIPQDVSDKILRLSSAYNLPDSFVSIFKPSMDFDSHKSP